MGSLCIGAIAVSLVCLISWHMGLIMLAMLREMGLIK